MKARLYREYRFKFYLNASHYIMIDGKEGLTHPHTWEFMLCIMKNMDNFVQFNEFERALDAYFEQYQNRVLNTVSPFDKIVPTLENMSDYFVTDIRRIVREIGGELVMLESSETPTRSYILEFYDDNDFIKALEKNGDDAIAKAVDSVVDSILE